MLGITDTHSLVRPLSMRGSARYREDIELWLGTIKIGPVRRYEVLVKR